MRGAPQAAAPAGPGGSGQSLLAHRRLCSPPEEGVLPRPSAVRGPGADRRATWLGDVSFAPWFHLAPRLIALLPAAANNAEEEFIFGRLSDRLGAVASPRMWPGQKDLPFVFLITSGKNRLLAGATAATALGLPRPRGSGFSAAWLSPAAAELPALPSAYGQEHPCLGLRGPPRGAACCGGVVPQTRGSRRQGSWASPCPRPSGCVAFPLTGEAERKSACQSPRPAGERPLTSGPPLPPAPGSPWEGGQVLRCRGGLQCSGIFCCFSSSSRGSVADFYLTSVYVCV